MMSSSHAYVSCFCFYLFNCLISFHFDILAW
uniref:Uncharacterized protein n=1 Tax=Rhizophora mucronata TaxID=61149 RepID=A0A2P2PA81_RHIMU